MRGLLILLFSIIATSILAYGQNDKSTEEDKELLYSAAIVDSVPTFNGGYDSLKSWMLKNIKYPEEEIGNYWEKIEVYASFIVEKDGSISDVNTYSRFTNFNIEVEKSLNKMPKWKPALDDNHPVRCRLMIPVHFSIEKSKK